MAVARMYQEDVNGIVGRRRDNGSDFWATPDGRWGVGSPFSTFDCAIILSFFNAAKTAAPFRQALAGLESKLIDGQLVVENPNRRLAKFNFCKKGCPSRVATRRYQEIMKNIGR